MIGSEMFDRVLRHGTGPGHRENAALAIITGHINGQSYLDVDGLLGSAARARLCRGRYVKDCKMTIRESDTFRRVDCGGDPR